MAGLSTGPSIEQAAVFGWDLQLLPTFQTFADVMLWVAAIVTIWTGWQYFREAGKQMN